MWSILVCLWLALSGKAPPSRAPRPRPPFLRPSRPRLEALEDRCLMSAGALDTTFNPTGSPPGIVTTSFSVSAVAIEADGKIVASNSGPGFGAARFNTNGGVDSSFNGTGSATTRVGLHDYPNAVAIQSDGKILVGGWSRLNYDPLNPTAQLYQFALVRYTTTGALDQSFGKHGIATSVSTEFGGHPYAMTIQPDGKIVMAGLGETIYGSAKEGIGLVRFNSNGSLDGSFGKGGWVFTPYNVFLGGEQLVARDVAIDSAGGLVVVGWAEWYGSGGGIPFMARYQSDGSLDTRLGAKGIIPFSQFPIFTNGPYIVGEALQPDGKILLTSGNEVIRLNPDGSLDTAAFGPLNPDGSHAGYAVSPGGFSSLEVQLESDGKIISESYAGVARLLSDGSLDPSFGNGGISLLQVGRGLAIQPADGNIVVAGAERLERIVGDTPTAAGASTLGLNYFPSPVRSGLTRTFTVWADNAVVGPATGYTGTVHFTSSDPQAVLPGDYTFTAADLGAHTFSATLWTPGTQSLFVTDTVTSSLAASQTGILIQPVAASHFSISAPASVTSGVPFSVTVTALDVYGNVRAYTGTVHVTSSSPSASLPADYTFLVADKGVHTFTGLVLGTKGKQTLTITDTWQGTIFGTISVDVL